MTTTVHEPIDVQVEDLHACDVMTRDVATVDGASSVGAALTVMRRLGVRHLPVTDDGGCFLGLVDDRLVTRALLCGTDRDRALEQPVDEVMTRYVPQVGPDEALSRVSACCAPVVATRWSSWTRGTTCWASSPWWTSWERSGSCSGPSTSGSGGPAAARSPAPPPGCAAAAPAWTAAS